ncbi:MAG: hypothetical protein Q6K70_05885 [Thermostichales cyanobacterium DRC_bins_46]
MGKGWLLLLLLWGSPAALAQVSFQDGVVLERQQRSIPLAGAADRIAIWNQRLLVGQMEAQSLASWSLEGGEVQWQLPLGLVPTVLLVDPLRRRLYVGGVGSPQLLVLDPEDGKLLGTVTLPGGVIDLTWDPGSGRVFAALPTARALAVIDPGALRLRTFAVPGSPLAVVFEPGSGRLITALAEPDPLGVLVMDPDNGELLARWRSGRLPEALALWQDQLLVLNSESQELLLLDLTSQGQRVQRVGLEWRPTRLAVAGDYAYVTSRDHNRLQVVHLPSARLEQTLLTQEQPTGIVALAEHRLAVVAAGVPAVTLLDLGEELGGSRPLTVEVGAIYGRVVDVAQRPVSQGQVRWQRQTVPIQEDGSYLLTQVPGGLQLVDVLIPGYPPLTQQVQVRPGFVSTPTLRLPPAERQDPGAGIGILPDGLPFSDELARQLGQALTQRYPDRSVRVLRSPMGTDPDFAPLQELLSQLTVVDRNQRYTEDLEKLRLLGSALGLRHILLTQVQIAQDYSRQGNPLVNLAFQFLAPGIPIQIPNFTPNMLRSRGVVVVVDLLRHRPGDKVLVYELSGQDDVGGDPLYEEAAAGLFRLQVRNMIPQLEAQWHDRDPLS